jgi:ubiquinone/menaquinone biosynthesis C-methylase UbiE
MAIGQAMDRAAAEGRTIRSALDIPCGTGRIHPLLSDRSVGTVGADLSFEMMQVARGKGAGDPNVRGFVRCDAERLPFEDRSFDAVFSIRFVFHLPDDVRRNAIREMARVSREWVIVDYRHRYTLKYFLKAMKLRLGFHTKPLKRVSRDEIAEDFRVSGLQLVDIYSTFPLFSDKWVVLARKIPRETP